MKREIFLLLILGALVASTACRTTPPPPPPTPPTGFNLRTFDQDFVNGIPTTPPIASPGIGVTSNFAFPLGPTTGTLENCNGTTDGSAFLPCPDRRTPAAWVFTFTSGFCFGLESEADVYAGDLVGFICKHLFRQFFISPETININAPPSTIELIGDGMNTTYGMPVIKWVDGGTGAIFATTTASAVSPDGTWLQAPTPYLGSSYSGQYAVFVFNVRPDGSLEETGGDTLDLFGNDPPPPPPPPPPDEDPCGGSPCLIQ
ncbi:MAG TPA: hypothetical protein VGJ66_24855 [Pyrinomonadaceae bacterium]|jgi:hypothetical protein